MDESTQFILIAVAFGLLLIMWVVQDHNHKKDPQKHPSQSPLSRWFGFGFGSGSKGTDLTFREMRVSEILNIQYAYTRRGEEPPTAEELRDAHLQAHLAQAHLARVAAHNATHNVAPVAKVQQFKQEVLQVDEVVTPAIKKDDFATRYENAEVLQTSPSPSTTNSLPKVRLGTDMRANTISTLGALPAQVAIAPSQGLSIPFMSDGTEMYAIKIASHGQGLVAGAKGSGKGNFLKLLALQSLALGPSNVELCILDAKGGVDYSFAKKIAHAHLYAKDDSDIMDGALYARGEMDNRYEILSQYEAANLNELVEITGKKLPYLIVICDEIADFTKETRGILDTIARKGRAAGVMLVVATQYPTAEVISSQTQSNLDWRLVFRVASSKYTSVALARLNDDGGTYEPSLIPKDKVGVAVWRLDGGNEIMGQCPEATRKWQLERRDELVAKWPKTSSESSESDDANMAQQMQLQMQMQQPSFSLPKDDPARDEDVLRIMQENDGISRRAIANLIWPENNAKGGGGYSAMVKASQERLREKGTLTTNCIIEMEEMEDD